MTVSPGIGGQGDGLAEQQVPDRQAEEDGEPEQEQEQEQELALPALVRFLLDGRRRPGRQSAAVASAPGTSGPAGDAVISCCPSATARRRRATGGAAGIAHAREAELGRLVLGIDARAPCGTTRRRRPCRPSTRSRGRGRRSPRAPASPSAIARRRVSAVAWSPVGECGHRRRPRCAVRVAGLACRPCCQRRVRLGPADRDQGDRQLERLDRLVWPGPSPGRPSPSAYRASASVRWIASDFFSGSIASGGLSCARAMVPEAVVGRRQRRVHVGHLAGQPRSRRPSRSPRIAGSYWLELLVGPRAAEAGQVDLLVRVDQHGVLRDRLLVARPWPSRGPRAGPGTWCRSDRRGQPPRGRRAAGPRSAPGWRRKRSMA